MGTSPLTGNIYYGTLNTEKNTWVGQKTDVTQMACQAVAEHLMHKKISKFFRFSDGKEIVLSVEILDSQEAE
ncbi:hypothetical protein GFW62_18610 [Salmonella enterica]|nr:hypothetical protein [Salmonella enterica]ECG6807090.1 hypothetical protein [Salmonella enterica subsp. enterica serovar Muenchen]OHG19161.1 hypothetical protein A7T52_19295 [Salmonella enterica subsp. diarizonae serovar 60:r:e,n,x,z15]ECC4751179.1 hypothetical protein [Salmonella enterica]ECC5735349.1 hypothetical protein [Salmonella enterica]